MTPAGWLVTVSLTMATGLILALILLIYTGWKHIQCVEVLISTAEQVAIRRDVANIL